MAVGETHHQGGKLDALLKDPPCGDYVDQSTQVEEAYIEVVDIFMVAKKLEKFHHHRVIDQQDLVEYIRHEPMS